MRSISVIVNTTGLPDRSKNLSNLLLSLSGQSVKDFELIVATERFDAELAEMFQKYFCPCGRHRLLVTGLWNKCRTANAAIRTSSGDVVVLLEDDLVLEKNWLEEALKTFDEIPNIGCVYTTCNWVYREGLSSRKGMLPYVARILSKLSLQESLFKKLTRRINDHLVEVPVFTMCVACKREALHKAGLFDEHVEEPVQGEDYDLALRIRVADYAIVANVKAVAYHFTRQVSRKALKASKDPRYIEGVYISEAYFFAKNLDHVGVYILPHMFYRVIEAFAWAVRSRKANAIVYGIRGLLRGVSLGLQHRVKASQALKIG